MSQPLKKPKKPQTIRTWLRQRTSPYCFGVKTKAGNPAHVNKNDDVRFHFQAIKMGWFGRHLSRLRNADMTDHFAGRKTFYFTADGRSGANEVLANIDIDCHKSGSLAGAIAFAEHLKATRFPKLYYEVSTNGNGVHGYVVIVKGDLGDEGSNAALSRLDKWLKHELSKGSWDVEAVEVKGQAPEFGWGTTKFELKSYKSGQLAKLPREALTRADELRGTTRLTVQELRKLPVPAADESEASVVHRGGKAAKKRPVVSVREGEKWNEEASVVSEKAENQASGSIAGHHFGPEELSKIGGGYLTLAKGLLGETKLVAKGRRVVTKEDVAVFLMLLRFFTNNMNADGSLPVARWREMWRALFGAGDVGRAWCHHRFATMRNFLSDRSLITWEDEDFVVGVLDDDGRFVPGKAAKWKGSDELMEMMDAVQVGGVDTSEVAGVEAVEVKEEEKSILYGHNQTHFDIIQLVADQDDLAEAPETTNPTPITPNPRQSTSFQTFLDDFGIWTPIPTPRFAGYSTGHYRMAA